MSSSTGPPLQRQNVSVPEMGRFQRQIVDNSLEEGQFQSGIDALDQLRSPDHKPSVIHILHLLYISLHPVHEISLNDDEPFDRTALLSQSPRKIIKQAKSALILTPEAVLSARRLLMSFALTNTPEDLGAALPQYSDIRNAPPMQFEHIDSPIFKQSEAIKTAKNCWEILKSGYRMRKLRIYASPKGKGKQTRNIFTSEPSFVTGNDGQEILPVDDDSWSTLNWLLTLFERDADLMEGQGELRYSPLLVKQIPLPSIGTITRWDTSEPLKLIFFAIQQEDPRKQGMGYRLLNLLIDLCHTPHLNLHFFASSVLSQLTSSSAIIPFSTSEIIPTFLSHLSSSASVLPFKIILCKRMLQDSFDHPDTPKLRSTARPKAQARAQPKALTRQRTQSDVDTFTSPPLSSVLSGNSMASISAADTTNISAATFSKASNTIPPWDEITRLLLDTNMTMDTNPGKSRPIWATHSLILRIKFELLFAYGMIHVHNKLESRDLEPEPGWNTSLKDGSLNKLMDTVFVARGSDEDEDALFYKNLLIGAFGLPET